MESGDTIIEVCRRRGNQLADVLLMGRRSMRDWAKRDVETAAVAWGGLKLKRLVADLSLDWHILQEIIAKALRPGVL